MLRAEIDELTVKKAIAADKGGIVLYLFLNKSISGELRI
jgi:hypothetical protein